MHWINVSKRADPLLTNMRFPATNRSRELELCWSLELCRSKEQELDMQAFGTGFGGRRFWLWGRLSVGVLVLDVGDSFFLILKKNTKQAPALIIR